MAANCSCENAPFANDDVGPDGMGPRTVLTMLAFASPVTYILAWFLFQASRQKADQATILDHDDVYSNLCWYFFEQRLGDGPPGSFLQWDNDRPKPWGSKAAFKDKPRSLDEKPILYEEPWSSSQIEEVREAAKNSVVTAVEKIASAADYNAQYGGILVVANIVTWLGMGIGYASDSARDSMIGLAVSIYVAALAAGWLGLLEFVNGVNLASQATNTLTALKLGATSWEECTRIDERAGNGSEASGEVYLVP
ncbi:hypothetical protein KFL_001840150 [Klebsormidium nitens]|uniref:Uncharacterized protein n=1 Tax=Klebsormidium nitens TaxID=105231 RepID=A0A1Y1I6H0_KLENI|nr:hypothetical protein KFL_001840150 [Klebsormidium nitens]|eukprot:GAQ84316.1 hypothetical protein KFL_001840150 [Klebsormidium nitens]